MFPLIASVAKDERVFIDEAIRVAAWTLMVLAFYQRYALGIEAPPSALPTPGAYAAVILLALPVALERSDRLLAAGLLVSFAWSGGVGAWTGLFAALALTSPWKPGARFYGSLAGLALCAVVLYGRIESAEFAMRTDQFAALAGAVAERPLLGAGPGMFQHFDAAPAVLILSAELGLPISFWDPFFAAPAVLWLFSYCAASTIPEGSEGIEIRLPWRFPVSGAALAAGYWVGRSALAAWGGR
jgi:hypothetical protein